jgi:hypothetical protein
MHNEPNGNTYNDDADQTARHAEHTGYSESASKCSLLNAKPIAMAAKATTPTWASNQTKQTQLKSIRGTNPFQCATAHPQAGSIFTVSNRSQAKLAALE